MATQYPKCNSENTDTAHFCSNCAAALQPSEEIVVPTQTIETPREELTTGSTFAGRYQIIEELGKGGMGKVYKAHDNEIKEKVALKLIKPEISADKKTIERFQNELKFARKIGHRNVCRMYDLNKEEGSYYITMEYVSGEDLKSFIRRIGQLPSGKAISIAKQVCEGLSEVHRLGVVHRDLKPSNIMIDKDGNVRIMDFGIARSLKEKGITGAGVMIGIPEYMSPEQVEGKEIDQRTDIYSLGVILYEMVTGRVPFEGETALTIAVKHKTEKPKDPREFNTQLSEDLSGVILRYLEKAKEKRCQNALPGKEPAGQGWGRQRMSLLYLHQGKFGAALEMMRETLTLANAAGQRMWEAMSHSGLAFIYLAAGNPEEALKECEETLSIARETDSLGIERMTLYYKGRALLDMNFIPEAQKTADELKTLIEAGLDEKIIRLYFHLAGCIELKKKNYPQAIEQFQRALTLLSFGPFNRSSDLIDSLATTYYESGDLEKATEQYESITKLISGKIGDPEIYVKSFYMLGKICDQQGDSAKAIEHYAKFLDLWKDADPGIAEVEDAGERLAGLKN